MTLRPRATTLLALAFGLALGGCTGSLYDAAGVPLLESAGCTTAGTHLCGGQCVRDDNPVACGPSCIDCTGTPVPSGGALACVNTGGGWGCGFSCTQPDRVCAARQACLPDDVNACGTGCEVCPGPTTGAGTGQPSCGPPAGGGTNVCGFTCAPGFLKVGAGCERPSAVVSGASHSCAITGGGGLVCWGANGDWQLGHAGEGGASPVQIFASGVTAVAAGAGHTCAVHAGSVTCWGRNVDGQLGRGTVSAREATPVAVTLAGATQLAAGASHTCALLGASGAVHCWGANASGQLGTGDLTAHGTPFASLVTADASQVAAFGDNTCAIVGAGLRCWGANDAGQTGKGSVSPREPTPVPVSPPAAPLQVSVGGKHACVLLGSLVSNQSVFCWGEGGEWQLGTTAQAGSLTLVAADQIDRNRDAAGLATGGAHSCAGRAAPEAGMRCGGRSTLGQIGTATPGAAGNDGSVTLAGHPLVASAGEDHTCALVDHVGFGLEVHCWGSNASGQLGRVIAPLTFDATPAVVGP